jgi:sigma-70-like protein
MRQANSLEWRRRRSSSDQSLATCLDEIGRYPLISRDEEAELARRKRRKGADGPVLRALAS